MEELTGFSLPNAKKIKVHNNRIRVNPVLFGCGVFRVGSIVNCGRQMKRINASTGSCAAGWDRVCSWHPQSSVD